MQAIELMRSRTFDIHGSPFYFYQDLSGYYNLVSHTKIASDDSNPVFRTYYDARNFSAEAGSADDYIERATRIIDCASDLKMAKLDQARRGAFASQTYSLDYATKTYKGKQYRYITKNQESNAYEYNTRITENALAKVPVISPSHKISKGAGQPFSNLSEFDNAHVDYIAKNTMAYKADINEEDTIGQTFNDLSESSIYQLNAFRALANTYTHDITVYGDFGLNPGKKLELKFPKAISPEDMKDILDADAGDIYDNALSGNYFIASVQHDFIGGEYYSKVRVKRDSMSVEMEGAK